MDTIATLVSLSLHYGVPLEDPARKFAHPRFELSGNTLNPQIAEALSGLILNHGVGVVIEAEHPCMKMHGIQKQNSRTLSSTLLGKFRDDSKTRLELLTLINHSTAKRCCLANRLTSLGQRL